MDLFESLGMPDLEARLFSVLSFLPFDFRAFMTKGCSPIQDINPNIYSLWVFLSIFHGVQAMRTSLTVSPYVYMVTEQMRILNSTSRL